MTVTITRVGNGYRLDATQRLPRPIDDVFAFFADASNLEEITPPTVRFEIVTPAPIAMKTGAMIDYRLRIRGIPLRWRSEITAWEPPFRFVDEQRRGPYRWWIHEHAFLEQGDETVVVDRVDYAVPGGEMVHRFLVGPDVRRIFTYRAERLRARFGGPCAPDPDSNR